MTMAVPAVASINDADHLRQQMPTDNSPLTHHPKHIQKSEQTEIVSIKNTTKTDKALDSSQCSQFQKPPNYTEIVQPTMNRQKNTAERLHLTTQSNPKKVKTSVDKTMDAEDQNPKGKLLQIDLSPNKCYYDLSEVMSVEELHQAKQAYDCLLGDEDPSKNAMHDDLSRIAIAIGKIVYETITLDQAQIKKVKGNKLSLTDWTEGANKILANDATMLTALGGDDNRMKALTILVKMAYTDPKKLFILNKHKTTDTMAARAYKAAITLLGSLYAKPQATVQTTIEDCFKKNTQKEVQFTPPHNETYAQELGKTTTPLTAVPTDAAKQKSCLKSTKNSAATVMDTTTNTARITIKYKVPAGKKKTPQDYISEFFCDLIEEYSSIDKNVAILPWKEAEMTKLPAIRKKEQVPKKLGELRPYADRLYPKPNSDCWFKIHIATDVNPECFLSLERSQAAGFFEALESGAYFATIQDSDQPTELAYLIYLGGYTDSNRITELIRQTSKVHNKGVELKIGARIKKVRELTPAKGIKDWIMADNSIVVLEIHQPQLKEGKNFIYKVINNTNTARPFGYPTRGVPTASLINSGVSKKGTSNHVAMLRKHQAVVNSLELSKTTSINFLDDKIQIGDKARSLRDILQELTFPLLPKEGSTKKPKLLFHTMDKASSGKDKVNGVTYFTAYKDRFELADKLVSILPAYIIFRFDHATAKAWFSAQAIDDCPSIVWGSSNPDIPALSYAEWDGTWQTEEDQQFQDLLDEDIGIELQLDGLDIVSLDEDKTKVIMDNDDQSFVSFNTTLADGKKHKQSQGRAAHSVDTDAGNREDAGDQAM